MGRPGEFAAPGVIDIERRVTESERPRLESAGINVIVGRREGLLGRGARTLSSDRSHAGISTTRTVAALGTFVRDLTSWAAFERSDVRTWNRLHGVVATALEGLRKKGAFAGETAADAYYVKADAEVNVPELAATGRIKVEFGFALDVPGNFVHMAVVQPSGNFELYGD